MIEPKRLERIRLTCDALFGDEKKDRPMMMNADMQTSPEKSVEIDLSVPEMRNSEMQTNTPMPIINKSDPLFPEDDLEEVDVEIDPEDEMAYYNAVSQIRPSTKLRKQPYRQGKPPRRGIRQSSRIRKMLSKAN